MKLLEEYWTLCLCLKKNYVDFEKFINFCEFFVNLQKFCLTIQKSVIELKIGNCSLLDKGEREGLKIKHERKQIIRGTNV